MDIWSSQIESEVKDLFDWQLFSWSNPIWNVKYIYIFVFPVPFHIDSLWVHIIYLVLSSCFFTSIFELYCNVISELHTLYSSLEVFLVLWGTVSASWAEAHLSWGWGRSFRAVPLCSVNWACIKLYTKFLNRRSSWHLFCTGYVYWIFIISTANCCKSK